jgi:Tfp pilus assembly protein PilN
MQQINLLSPQLLAPRVRFSGRTLALLLGGLLLAGLVVYGWVAMQTRTAQAQMQALQTQRDEAQSSLDALTQPTDQGLTPQDRRAQELAALRARLAHLDALRAALGGGPDAARFSPQLRALAVQGLPGVWLTGIEFRRDGFRLDGRALQPAQIPDYLALLSERPALHGLALTGFRIGTPTDDGAVPSQLAGVAFTVNPSALAAP